LTFIAVIITAVVYLISVVSVTIYFFVVSHRTLQQLKKSSGRHSSRKNSLRRVRFLSLCLAVKNNSNN
jgi:Ni/Fe-hydrogenase subunit HybB-like protein